MCTIKTVGHKKKKKKINDFMIKISNPQLFAANYSFIYFSVIFLVFMEKKKY